MSIVNPYRFILFLFIGISLTFTLYVHANECTDEELVKMRAAGFAQKRISEICGEVTASKSMPLEVLKKLAAIGNTDAAFELGHRYEAGEGIIRDYIQAYSWYARAYAASGSAKHKSALDGLESKMDPSEIEKAQSLGSNSGNEPQPTTSTPPRCQRENIAKWKPREQTLTFEGSSTAKGFGFPSQSAACSIAKKDSRELFDGIKEECGSKFNGSRYRNVQGKEVPGHCDCENNRDIGMGFSCDYKFTVECEAEERVTETVESCF